MKKPNIKTGLFIFLITATALVQTAAAQKTRYDRVSFSYYRLPQLVLDSTYKTYAVNANIPDYMGGNYAAANMNYSLQHLKKAQSPADIEVNLNYPYYREFIGVPPKTSSQSSKSKVNGQEVTTITYSKSGGYEQPYQYKIVNNRTGQVIEQKNNTWLFTVTTSAYATEAEANQAWENTLRSQASAFATQEHNKLAAYINGTLAALFYKGMVNGSVDVYYIKDKDDYAELDSAAQIARAAYETISRNTTDTGRAEFVQKIQPAMKIWEALLAQKEDSKKARINAKVAAVLLFNLAHAAYWQRDFDHALAYARAADENGKLDDWAKNFIKNCEAAKK